MLAAFNEQIRNEFASAYLYLSMSAWLESQNFPGGAHWMKAQYKEELTHGEKLFGLVNDRNGRVILEGIDKPAAEFGTLAETFKAVLAHEQKVTACINKVYEVALAEKDYAAQIELQWFIKEQVEEEKTVQDILIQLEACDNRPHLMLMIDHHLAKRGG
jgi:ferritin